MEYLKEIIQVDVNGKQIPVGTIGDYIFIETPKTARLLYKRLNRNRSSNNTLSMAECTELAEKIQRDIPLQRLEEMMLYYEAYPIKVDPFAKDDGSIDPTGFFQSHGLAEAKAQLETLYSHIYDGSHLALEYTYPRPGEALPDIYKGSHRALKYDYRIGFDIDTGKQAAVQFILEPDKIIAIGDRDGLSSSVLSIATKGKIDPKSPEGKNYLDNLHKEALDEVKQTIQKRGHIDHMTNALKVDAIFTRDHQSLKTVRIVTMFNIKVLQVIADIIVSYKKSGKSLDMTYDDLFKTSEFQKEFAKRIKIANIESEEYTVGKEGGADTYKTTKLFWDPSQFTSFMLTPVVRGYIPK